MIFFNRYYLFFLFYMMSACADLKQDAGYCPVADLSSYSGDLQFKVMAFGGEVSADVVQHMNAEQIAIVEMANALHEVGLVTDTVNVKIDNHNFELKIGYQDQYGNKVTEVWLIQGEK